MNSVFKGVQAGVTRVAAGYPLRLRRDRRANTALLVALLFPVFFGIAALGVDVSRLYYMKTVVSQSTKSAALAAGYQLTNYYTGTTQMSTTMPTSISTAAVNIASANAPTGPFGNVVTAANMTLGTWSNSSNTFTALSGSGPFAPNSVQVKGYASSGRPDSANNNPIKTFFGGLIGQGSVNVSYTATASFGSNKPFNVIVVNDLSSSFSAELSNQQVADKAILDCVSYGNTSGMFGVTSFNGDSGIVVALQNASANNDAIKTAIDATVNCSTAGNCSGSNVAAGLYSAIQQYEAHFLSTTTSVVGTNETTWTTSAPGTTVNNIVIITDGQPNATTNSAHPAYSLQDGVTTNGSSALCTTLCTNANLNSAAVYQETSVATRLGIQVSTIYYTESSTAAATVTADTTFLASLKSSLGTSLVTPTSGQIATYGGGVCTLMGSKLVG